MSTFKGFTDPEQPPHAPFQPFAPVMLQWCQSQALLQPWPECGGWCPGWAMGKGDGEQKWVVRATKVCGCLQCSDNIISVA